LLWPVFWHDYVHNIKLERRRPLGRPKCRWADNVKRDLGEIGWSGVGWNGLAQDRDKWRAIVNVVMNCRIP
jgi:hypothetical protein